MRHNKKKGLKLGTSPKHTRAMKRSLVKALFTYDRIKTTEARAKAIRGDVDGIITWAKKGDLHSRRLAIAKLDDKYLVAEIFDKAAQGAWADRNGGYTRIMKLGPRKGDGAEMVIMELIYEPVQKKEPAADIKKKSNAPQKVSKEEAPVEEEPETSAEEASEAPAEEEQEASVDEFEDASETPAEDVALEATGDAEVAVEETGSAAEEPTAE